MYRRHELHRRTHLKVVGEVTHIFRSYSDPTQVMVRVEISLRVTTGQGEHGKSSFSFDLLGRTTQPAIGDRYELDLEVEAPINGKGGTP